MADKLPPLEILQRFNGVPLLLESRALEALLAGQPMAPTDRERALSRDLKETNGVMTVPIHGVLMKRGFGDPRWDAVFGIIAVETITANMRVALAAKPKGIVLDIDSPGGEVPGLFDLADEIMAAREQGIPMIAVANEWAASGGYLLAAAANEIMGPRTALVGSIGAKMARLDLSGLDKNLGIKYRVFTSGAKKSYGDPHVAMSADEEKWFQEQVDFIGGMFVDFVAKARSMSADSVRSTEAGVYRGEDAVGLKLMNRIGTYEEALTTLADAGARRQGGGATMKDGEKKVEGGDQTPPAKVGADDNVVQLDKVREQAKLEGRNEEQARTKEIGRLCATAKHPELAASFIAQGLTGEQCSVRLAELERMKALCQLGRMDAETSSKTAVDMVSRGLSMQAAIDEITTKVATDGDRQLSIQTQHVGVPTGDAPTSDLSGKVKGFYEKRKLQVAKIKSDRQAAMRAHGLA